MLRFHRIPYWDGSHCWEISPLTGSLLKSKHNFATTKVFTKKIQSSIYYINNPYEIVWEHNKENLIINEDLFLKIKSFNKKLFTIGNSQFIRSILYSYFQYKVFEKTKDAFSYIADLEDHKYGSENCFQRTLLAAKTSKTFKKDGVLFIGAELSSFNMHAWIIENNSQPDFEDRAWINYRPLLAITF